MKKTITLKGKELEIRKSKPFFTNFCLLSLFVISGVCSASNGKKYNVLFIPIDDFKPLIGAYGEKQIITPNMDRLADQGMIFNNAHCQYAICGSSRASVMSGMYIDSVRVFSFTPKMREANPDILTLPQYFKQQGYQTTGIGKTYDSRCVDKKRDALSWSLAYREYIAPDEKYGHQKGGYRNADRIREIARLEKKYSKNKDLLKKQLAAQGLRPLTESEDYPDVAYSDGQKTLVAMKMLEDLSKDDKPFFLSVGYQKPHLPFVAPKKYWDLYEREKINLPFAGKAKGSPSFSYGNMGELHSYSMKEKLPFSDAYKREITHGYYACVSFIDAQIGQLIDKLEELEIRDNTIICLWGDHGWHLGDHNLWCKHSNFEQAVRSPLIISAPGMKAIGKSSQSPVGLVDIFPTLCDLTGLVIPKHLQGESLKPILDNAEAMVKEVEMAQYPRTINGKDAMGYTVRSKRYRYTAWKQMDYRKGELEGPIVAEELYDYEKDPSEKSSFIKNPEYQEIKLKLRQQLEKMITKGQKK
ncbi:sulfatase [Lentisphaera profundi]|uniref:Sulfatase n=1 Tax=Lentisphaera profundi TaxID=1658616 RepID=A0ABY7VW54_9BACT|nr:sulfatase [Lentisphaera profundi]WDE98465.1 sulfatase [Lentisphaera profundi]